MPSKPRTKLFLQIEEAVQNLKNETDNSKSIRDLGNCVLALSSEVERLAGELKKLRPKK